MTDSMDILPRADIRYRAQRPPKPSVSAWEAYVTQASHMPSDAALRLPSTALRRDVVAAVRRYCPGKLFVRSDIDGRLILTRRRNKAEAREKAKQTFMEVLDWKAGEAAFDEGFKEGMVLAADHFPLFIRNFPLTPRPAWLDSPLTPATKEQVAQAMRDGAIACAEAAEAHRASCRPGPHDATGSPVEGEGG